MREFVCFLIFLVFIFPREGVAEGQGKYELGIDMFGLGYSTYQNGSPPDGEDWSGPSVFFTYNFSDFWSLKTSYYTLSTEGYDMVDVLPWNTLKKARNNDMSGLQTALQFGRHLYGSIGIYKNFKDFLFVVDKQGVMFTGGYKIRIGSLLIDISPLGFRVPIQKEDFRHTSGMATLGISYAF